MTKKSQPKEISSNPTHGCTEALDACILSMHNTRGLSPREIAQELPGLEAEQIEKRLYRLKFVKEI